MVKSEEQILNQYRYALALRMLLELNKKAVKKGLRNETNLDDSYNKISSSTNLRKATISEALSGLSEIKAFTIHQILTSLGKTYTQFGKIIDQLSDSDIMKFKLEKELEREERKKAFIKKAIRKRMNR